MGGRLQAWATHPEQVAVKKLGRKSFYAEYHLQVCEVLRESLCDIGADEPLACPSRAANHPAS